jgi:hypothetical protein
VVFALSPIPADAALAYLMQLIFIHVETMLNICNVHQNFVSCGGDMKQVTCAMVESEIVIAF